MVSKCYTHGGGQTFCAINGKTGTISYNNQGYGTYTYSDAYVTIYFADTYGMYSYAVAKQKFKYSYATVCSDYSNAGGANQVSSANQTIVPKRGKGDGAYTSTLIIY